VFYQQDRCDEDLTAGAFWLFTQVAHPPVPSTTVPEVT